MCKKIVTMLCSLILVFGIAFVSVNDTKASGEVPVIDGSYLTQDRESIGYATAITRGIDLLNGYSKVVRLGPEIIYVGGTTMASHKVDDIGITVLVERVKKDGELWEFVDGWSRSKTDTDRVAASKQLDVEGDYYYRVRCIHTANHDIGESFTNGIYVEKKSGILSTTN